MKCYKGLTSFKNLLYKLEVLLLPKTWSSLLFQKFDCDQEQDILFITISR